MRSTQLINDYSLVMQRHKADMCRFGDYDLHDLIELDQQTVGVMIQADAETCQVLTNRNAVSHHPVPAKLDARTSFQFSTSASCLYFVRICLRIAGPL